MKKIISTTLLALFLSAGLVGADDTAPTFEWKEKRLIPNSGIAGTDDAVAVISEGELILKIHFDGQITGSDGRTIGWLNEKEIFKFNKGWAYFKPKKTN